MIFPLCSPREGEAGSAEEKQRALRCINNIYRAVISPDREQTEEIRAEDGFILKMARKHMQTWISDSF